MKHVIWISCSSALLQLSFITWHPSRIFFHIHILVLFNIDESSHAIHCICYSSRNHVHSIVLHANLSQFLHFCLLFPLQSMLIIFLPVGFILWPTLQYSGPMKSISAVASNGPIWPPVKRSPSGKSANPKS